MKCPYCKHPELKVNDSRDTAEGNAIRRRRECLHCLRRFTTYETVELSLQVLKRDGRYEEFQQQKLVNGLDAASRHTKVSHEQVLEIASKITNELLQRQVHAVTTTELGEMVMRELQQLDSVAYIRFACVYRRFKNIDELVEAIQTQTQIEGVSKP